jgi:hypothetical protein
MHSTKKINIINLLQRGIVIFLTALLATGHCLMPLKVFCQCDSKLGQTSHIEDIYSSGITTQTVRTASAASRNCSDQGTGCHFVIIAEAKAARIRTSSWDVNPKASSNLFALAETTAISTPGTPLIGICHVRAFAQFILKRHLSTEVLLC